MRISMVAALVAVTMLCGCGSIDYERLEAGTFKGGLFVMWVGEGGPSGDGDFVFVPDPGAPLTFTTGDGKRKIRPPMMYTDGGSIPPAAKAFQGFSPWGYAPAYMIHDWLFTARRCLVDGDPDPRYAALKDVNFQESAEILGEAIKALVEAGVVKRRDVAGSAISSAVAGPIAKGLWDQRGQCQALKVRPEHRARAEAAIPGSSAFAERRARGFGRAATHPGTRAKIITRIGF